MLPCEHRNQIDEKWHFLRIFLALCILPQSDAKNSKVIEESASDLSHLKSDNKAN